MFTLPTVSVDVSRLSRVRWRVLRFCVAVVAAVSVSAGGCDTSDTIPEPAWVLAAPESGLAVRGLWRPRGVAVGPGGEVYVAESGSGRVRVLDLGGGEAVLLQDTATAANAGAARAAWSRPAALWGQSLVYVGGDTLLMFSPGQAPVLLSTAGVEGDAAPVRLGVVGDGEDGVGVVSPGVGVRLGDLDLRGVSGFGLVDGPEGDALLALDDRIWLVSRPAQAGLADATLSRVLAGNGAHALGPLDAPDATQIPLALSAWTTLTPHPDGGFFFAEGEDRLRLVTPGGRALVLTGQGSLRHTRAEGMDLGEFGARFSDTTVLRWHPTEGALYFFDSLWVLKLRLDTSPADLDAPSPTPPAPQGRVTYAAYRLAEAYDFALSPQGALIFTLGFTGTLFESSRDGLNTYKTLYGPDPLDTELGQINADRYNLNPAEPYASRHAPFAMRAPLLPQGLALWGDGNLIVSNPLSRALQTVKASEDAPWTAREFLYDTKSQSLGWPFIAQSLARPNLLYVSDLNTLQAWSLTSDGLAALSMLTLTSPPPNGIPGPGLDAILTQTARLDANTARLALLNPDTTVTGLEFKNQQITKTFSAGLGVLPPQGTRSVFSFDLSGAQSFDTSLSGDQYAFALPIPASWDNSADGGHILAITHLGPSASPPLSIGGLSLPPKLAAHLAGGGSTPIASLPPSPNGTLAFDAFLQNITALDIIENIENSDGPTGIPQSVLFAVPDETGDDTTYSRLFYLDHNADNTTPTLHDLNTSCSRNVPDITWLKTLALAPNSPHPTAIIAADNAILWGCSSEPGWTVGDTPLTDQWTPISGVTHAAFAPDARAVVLLKGVGNDTSPFEVQVLPVNGPQQPSQIPSTQTHKTPDAALWTAIATPPDASLLIAQTTDPNTQTITLQAARLRDNSGDGSVFPSVQTKLPNTERIAGGGQGLGDGGLVSALAPGRKLAGLTVAPDGSLYIAVSDTQTLWHLPTARIDDTSALDRASLLALGDPLALDLSASIIPLAADDAGVFVGSGERIYHINRQTKAARLVAGGGSNPPTTASTDALSLSLGTVQGLATLNQNLYALTTGELLEISPNGTATPLSRDGLVTLSDGTSTALGFEVMGGAPLIASPPSSLLMVAPQTHSILRIPISQVRLTPN